MPPIFVILGAPINDEAYCTAFIEERRIRAKEVFLQLPKLNDLQVAVTLLCMCGAYNKLARCTPSDLAT